MPAKYILVSSGRMLEAAIGRGIGLPSTYKNLFLSCVKSSKRLSIDIGAIYDMFLELYASEKKTLEIRFIIFF